MAITIRDALPADFSAIVELNDAEVHHTSPMDIGRIRDLDALSAYHKVVERERSVVAFLFAMTGGAAYRNDNYAWFAERYPDFLYVDRIVVGAEAAGLGIGSLLYDDLFACARRAGIPVITCEYNLVPANEPSKKFHDKWGFREVGEQWLGSGAKQVSLQAADVIADGRTGP